MRARRVEVHPKVAGQPLPAVLQTIMPRLQKDKQLKSDAIQNTENAIADLVSKGEPFAGTSPWSCNLQAPVRELGTILIAPPYQ